MSETERRAVEDQLRQRDREEGRVPGRMRRGLLYGWFPSGFIQTCSQSLCFHCCYCASLSLNTFRLHSCNVSCFVFLVGNDFFYFCFDGARQLKLWIWKLLRDEL